MINYWNADPVRRAALLALAAGCLAVPAWVATTRWSTLAAGHPAYPLSLAAAAAFGLLLAARAHALTRRQQARHRPAVAVGRGLAVVSVVALLGALAWLRPFPADTVAVDAGDSDAAVTILDTPAGIELRPDRQHGAGVVFYPGARVDPRAYFALLRPLAERGHVVVIVAPPFGIALLPTTGVDEVADARPDVGRWVVAGHSLGGVAAAGDAIDGDPRACGVLLWAAYPVDDLSGSGLAVASVSGERDGLTTPADVQATRSLLPAGAAVTVVPGAVHAYFGDYGAQPGDGVPTVDRETAQHQIRAVSLAFVDRSC